MLRVRSYLTLSLSHHPSISSNALDRSYKLHPVSDICRCLPPDTT